MTGYGSREVSRMLGLSVGQLRSYVRAGFLKPARGPRGELRFNFQDLVLLRTAQGLVGARKWSAEDGQVLFDFGTAEIARRIAPLGRKASPSLDADGSYERGCDLEE